MTSQETIFALASGAGTAGVAVVRISGPKSLSVLENITKKPLPKPRYASLRELTDQNGNRLDQALILIFPTPNSFTGEDVVELHLHGGRSVIEGVLTTLGSFEGLRMAEPGEFSRRAFENDKMDLTAVEGLNDLIHAQTLAQRTQALAQMDGGLREIYEGWRSQLLGYLGHLEADIDFPDEDLPEGVAGAVKPNILKFKNEIIQYLDDNRRGQVIRDGFKVVILGEPNVGKSTLLNTLAKSDVAIVSDEEGTTRDTIEIQLDLGGYPVRLIDTAGIRNTDNAVEKEGIRRAFDKANDADLKLVLVRADQWPKIPKTLMGIIDEKTLIIITKSDTVDDSAMFHVEQLDQKFTIFSIQSISVRNKLGIDELFKNLSSYIADQMDGRDLPSLTRLRHRSALETCIEHLERFEDNAGFDAVLAAEDIRMAVRSLGEITGRVDVEDMLDIVFSDFCIGK
ncbi:tRNA uridine-5-carboxymethylaminomethyl(34) synthesis GTPase MnmE [Kordiimonas sp. SCSIO 12610]|uniref:tRNA uridine-5-carboxymethylaminomethyl(34) synthesis GTPase MnmE n=1 Tax=Kordiimonas sp. SCSIO 12610 TaxID=2829597 RepID=UPI0021097C64|nr:tRNA uridine-5-carboxymethylaminomethyl(34) synthesis GTPase MnmE [Kordiimonas sp. SCSIO 12610]UTW55476.1 tRNA uridine-5-carboxymethylaminomethyl(34) synthesis GTPase MnmE [Kordiimonas sp. SCSIO 12610]